LGKIYLINSPLLGEPVRLVRISIDGQKPVVKGGDKGGYFIQNLPPGQHKLVFTRQAYQE